MKLSVIDIKIRKTTPLSLFIVGIMMMMPILDVLTGMETQGKGYGKFVRFFLLSLAITIVMLSFYKDALKPEVLAFVSFIGFATLSLEINGLREEDFIFTLKLILIPAFYLAISYLLRCRLIDRNKLINGLWLSTLVVVALCYSLFFFRVGAGTYSDLGFKGGFIAGNELAVYLVVTYPIVLVLALRHGTIFWLPVLPTALLMILLGTKASMLGLVIESLLVSVFWSKIHHKSVIKNLTLTLVFMTASVAFVIIKFKEILAMIVLDRWIYFLNKVDILSFLLSHRNIHLQDAWKYFSARGNLFTLMFGHGFTGSLSHMHMVEIDIFDVYFSLGFTGLFSLSILWFIMFYRVYNGWRREKCRENIMFIVPILPLVIQICFVGHVVYSTLASIVLSTSMAIGASYSMFSTKRASG